MKSLVFIGGCAGTNTPAAVKIASPSRASMKPLLEPWSRTEFGTLTTSFGIVHGDTGVYIDNGVGIIHVVDLFNSMGIRKVFGLQTHFHMDHMFGLQNNSLLLERGRVETMFGPNLGGKSFSEIFERSFDPMYWPIGPKTFGIDHTILGFEPGADIDILFGVSTFALNHPGGSVAYRIHLPNGDVVIATDAEVTPEKAEDYARFVSGARLLYADVQYRTSEYEGKEAICGGLTAPRKNWGHSTPEMIGAALTHCAEVPRIILAGHHDPSRNDKDLGVFEQETIAALHGLEAEVRFARECDYYIL